MLHATQGLDAVRLGYDGDDGRPGFLDKGGIATTQAGLAGQIFLRTRGPGDRHAINAIKRDGCLF